MSYLCKTGGTLTLAVLADGKEGDAGEEQKGKKGSTAARKKINCSTAGICDLWKHK